MAAEYPLLMLPEPSEQVKGDRNGGPTRLHRPDIAAQGRRLEPMYKRLCGAFDRERVKVSVLPIELSRNSPWYSRSQVPLTRFMGLSKG